MLHSLFPAAAFTAATAAPATLPVLAILDFAGRHLVGITTTAVALVVLLVAWSFRRDHRQHRAITTAHDRWAATGQPQGWAPGWAWSGFSADPEDDEDQAEELPAAAEAVCESCHQQPATVTVAVAGGPTFRLCTGCSPVATVLGRTA